MTTTGDRIDPEPRLGPSEQEPKIEHTFIISQLQQHVESYRMVITLTVQLMTVLVLANVTLVGYAISQQIAGILLFGPIFPIGIIATVLMVGRAALPIIYSFVNLERKYGGDRIDWLGKTFFSFLVSPKFVQRVLEIGMLPNWPQRYAQLRKLPLAIVGTGKGIIRVCLGVIALAQIAAALVLWYYFDWRMF
jgi:hypothetical protein